MLDNKKLVNFITTALASICKQSNYDPADINVCYIATRLVVGQVKEWN